MTGVRHPGGNGRRDRKAVPAWVSRVLDGSVTQLRAEYTFLLARLCACPPPVAVQLRLFDFARLLSGIDQEQAALRRGGE